ncbi:MAG: pseudouridine synthase [Thermosulfidibacteraceae bacterium]
MEGKKLRLDRFLVNAGVGSRSVVRDMIREGLITVNGMVVRDISCKVSVRDEVSIEGRRIELAGKRYYKMYKPKGVITSTKDKDLTLFDLLVDIPRVEELFPVGRLDKDAEGLVLITNDGLLAHRLTHPKWKVRKVYEVYLENPILVGEVDILLRGVNLKDGPVIVEDVGISDEGRVVRITVTEGRYHLVKRIFSALGNRVLSLKRIAFGPIDLGGLSEGEVRELERKEIEELYKVCELK